MNIQSLLEAGIFLQVSGITPGRAAALVPALLGIIGVIIGRRALIRSVRNVNPGEPMGIVSLVLGFTGIVLSVLHLARSTGGFGTGSGKLGAIVALVLGLISMMLGGLALVRSRRIARRSSDGAERI